MHFIRHHPILAILVPSTVIGILGVFTTLLAKSFGSLLATLIVLLTALTWGLLFITLIFLRRIHTWTRTTVRDSKKLSGEIRSLHPLIQQTKDLQERVRSLESRRYILKNSNKGIPTIQRLEVEPPSIYSSSLIGSYTAPAPTRGIKGRLAADRTTDPQSPHKLWLATHSDPQHSRLTLALVCTDQLYKNIQSHGFNTIRLRPGMLAPNLVSQAQVIIVEQEAFRSGMWRGADSALNTHLAKELLAFLRQSRPGSSIIFIPNGQTTHFTSSYTQLASSVFTPGARDMKWAADRGTVVHQLLEHITTQEGNR